MQPKSKQMLAIYSLAYFQRTGIPGTIFDELQHDFDLSASAVTALGSIFVYVYAAMQLVVGIAADRYGGRRTLLFGSVVMCVGQVMFPCAHSTTTLFASRVLIGFGSARISQRGSADRGSGQSLIARTRCSREILLSAARFSLRNKS